MRKIDESAQKTENQNKYAGKIVAFISIAFIAAIAIAIIHSAGINPNNNGRPTEPVASPYAEIDYKTTGWFYGSYIAGLQNNTYLLLNVTVINRGYSSQVNCEPWNFAVTVNGVSYDSQWLIPYGLYNGTQDTFGQVNFVFNALQNVKLANNAETSGFLAFRIPNPSLSNRSFTLAASLTFGINYLAADIRIFKK